MSIEFENFSYYAKTAGLERRTAIQLTTPKDATHEENFFKASETDKSWSLTRSSDDKDANNLIRKVFLNSIQRKTGLNIDELPQAIKTALELSDYDLDDDGKVTSGKPLTAYRIRQVATALEDHAVAIEQIKIAKQTTQIQAAKVQSQLALKNYSTTLDNLEKDFKQFNTDQLNTPNRSHDTTIAMLWVPMYFLNLLYAAKKLSSAEPDRLQEIKKDFDEKLTAMQDILVNGHATEIRYDPAKPNSSTVTSRLDEDTRQQLTDMVNRLAIAFKQQLATMQKA